LLLLSTEFRQSLYTNEHNVLIEAKAVAMMPGQTVCFVRLACRLAGKPFPVDEFEMDELVAAGKATPADISAMPEAKGIRWIPKTLTTGADADTSFLRWWRSVK